ncbi:unnamed protein product [marine sediment metagenome]|uniref:Uncharacterized protein n=1 Tax=marine sediment metagenome TaxID=412755 RepID=X1UPV2_9ZZZZ
MSNMKTLDNIFKGIENLTMGVPADWDKIEYIVLQVLRADHDGKAYFQISEEDRETVVKKARNILIGEETL